MKKCRLLALALAASTALTSPALAAFTLTSLNQTQVGSSGSSLANSANLTVASGTLLITAGMINTMANASDSPIITSPNGTDVWTLHKCPRAVGDTTASFVASTISNGWTAQKITLTETAGNSWGQGAYLGTWSLTGAAASSPEDAVAYACAGLASGTTTPSVASNAPTGAGEFFFSFYGSPSSTATISYSEDTGHGWTGAPGVPNGGSSRVAVSAGYQTNAGSVALTHAPSTASFSYAMPIVAFCPSGGCVSGSSTPGRRSLLGVGQ